MVRTLPRKRPVKPPTPKTSLKMHANSVFNELKLVIKMTKRSKTHKDNQTRTKKHDSRMQWFDLSTNDTIKLLIESPPLIVRPSNLKSGLPTTIMTQVK